MPVGALTALGTGLGASLIPASIGTLGTIGLEGLIGAGIGAGSSAIFGRDPGKGAITGGLGGLAAGFSPLLGSALDISPAAANVLLGAGTGAGGAALTGADPLKGALTGGVAGGIESLAQGALGGGSPRAPAGGQAAAPSAASPGAATAIQSGGLPDLTSIPTTTAHISDTIFAPPSPSAGSFPSSVTPASIFNPTDVSVTAPALSAPASGGGGALPALGAGAAGAALGAGSTTTHIADTIFQPTASSIANPGAGTSLGSGGSAALGGSNTGGALDSGTKLGSGIPNYTPSAGAGSGKSLVPLYGKGASFPSEPNLGSDLTKTLTSPSTLLSLGALGLESSMQPKLPSPSATVGTLQTEASQLNTTGAQLESYLLKGGLPPGVQQALSTATRSAKATIRSQYASMGLTGSTAEASALAGIDSAAAQQTFDIANNLMQTGLKMTGMSDDLYKLILETATAENQSMGSAISNFASAIATSGRPAPAAAA